MTIEKNFKKPSLEQLRIKSGDDCRKIHNLYEAWDKSARKKDFEECERQERTILKIHKKHGIDET